MVCGGFTCSRNSLAALNVLYILVSFILIGVAAYGRLSAVVTSLTLVGSLIACGVFLFFIALTGLIGALKHHQVLLFFYMIILFLLFLLQFSLACACLAFNSEQQRDLVERSWNFSSQETKNDVQSQFQCCGFNEQNRLNASDPLAHPKCDQLDCCKTNPHYYCCSGNLNDTMTSCPCPKCSEKLQNQIHAAFKVTGGVGLFFSFTEIIGVWLAMRYRNQKDPRANPSAFL